jgi:hypothetical protein
MHGRCGDHGLRMAARPCPDPTIRVLREIRGSIRPIPTTDRATRGPRRCRGSWSLSGSRSPSKGCPVSCFHRGSGCTRTPRHSMREEDEASSKPVRPRNSSGYPKRSQLFGFPKKSQNRRRFYMLPRQILRRNPRYGFENCVTDFAKRVHPVGRGPTDPGSLTIRLTEIIRAFVPEMTMHASSAFPGPASIGNRTVRLRGR